MTENLQQRSENYRLPSNVTQSAYSLVINTNNTDSNSNRMTYTRSVQRKGAFQLAAGKIASYSIMQSKDCNK